MLLTYISVTNLQTEFVAFHSSVFYLNRIRLLLFFYSLRILGYSMNEKKPVYNAASFANLHSLLL